MFEVLLISKMRKKVRALPWSHNVYRHLNSKSGFTPIGRFPRHVDPPEAIGVGEPVDIVGRLESWYPMDSKDWIVENYLRDRISVQFKNCISMSQQVFYEIRDQ